MEKHYCLLAVVQSFKAYIVLLDCEIPPSKCLKDGKKKTIYFNYRNLFSYQVKLIFTQTKSQ